MRLLGVPIESPQTVVSRILSDLGAVARLARVAPGQIDRMLELGEEIATIGRAVLEIAERLDARAEAVLAIGQRLDERAAALLELGTRIEVLGGQVDTRGAEIVDSATQVAETGSELIGVLPTLERALQMASPLEGAIDRFGRLVDRLPGGASRRNIDEADPTDLRSTPGRRPAAS
jgi:Zn-dependent alcohol dehydrogenase